MDDDSDYDSDSSGESSESSGNSSEEEEEEDEEEEDEEEEDEVEEEEDEFSDSEPIGFTLQNVPPCYEAIHGTTVVKKKSNGKKKRVSFPSGDNLVLIHVIPNRKMLGLHSESDSDSSEDSEEDVKVKRTTSKPITNGNGDCKRFAKKFPEKMAKTLVLSNTNNTSNTAKSKQKRKIRRPTAKSKQDKKDSQKNTNSSEDAQNVNDVKETGKQKRRAKGSKKAAGKKLDKLDKSPKRKSARTTNGKVNSNSDSQNPRSVMPTISYKRNSNPPVSKPDLNGAIAVEGITLSSKNKVHAGVIKVSKDKDFIETLTSYHNKNGFMSSREADKSDYSVGKKHFHAKQEKRAARKKKRKSRKGSSKSLKIAAILSKKEAQLMVSIQAKQSFRSKTPSCPGRSLEVGCRKNKSDVWYCSADLLRYYSTNDIM